MQNMFSKDPSSHFGVQKQNLILVLSHWCWGRILAWVIEKRADSHLMPSKYHTTGLCSGSQCEHCLILQASLLFGLSRTGGKRSYERTEQISQWLPSLSVRWWKPLLLMPDWWKQEAHLQAQCNTQAHHWSAFYLVFIMKVNYLRPSQKRPRLILRRQNVCFIPGKFPESPATVYGELMLKNLNGG